ncbi:MAG: family 78 glycoside hydrolase catalytic domain, partial [Clostridia bacterium]|nr:family 78 glycoside hydrolase catalytic domain [Clostridia bacterium]
MLKITDVLTEYKKNPVGIDNERPLFGWKYEQAADALQYSYRIEVAGSEELLAARRADLWDSGEVISSRQFGIEYGGKPLKSAQIAYFKVTVKDGEGNESVSETGRFEMGLLSEDDWKGEWVSMPVNFQGGAVSFRKELEFPTDKEVERVRVYVCAAGYHELYFNGKKIGDAVLQPPVTDYTKTVTYCVYDVTPEWGEKNVIGVLVGHGWLGDRKLLAQINVRYKDGTVAEDHTRNCWGWWMSGSPIVSDSIYGGEVYDARLEDKYEGWAAPGYVSGWENGWLYTFLTPALTGKKTAMSIEPIRVCAVNRVKSIKKTDKNTYLIDAGTNMAGWLKITAEGERGAKMTVRYAEDLSDGKINRLNLRSAACEDVYIFRGNGEESYAPRFTYHGFRYAEIVTEGKVKLGEITSEFVHSDVKPIGSFRSDNDVINKLHRNAFLTEANNLHSIMTDCPQRDERLGWLNDLSSRIYQTVNNYSMENFFPKIVKDITDTQNDKGEIADTAPFFTGSRPADPVSVCYLLFAIKSYRLYGNDRVLREYYDNFKAWTESLLSHSDGYIMDYTYYNDWVAPVFDDVRTDGIYVSTVYLYWHLKCMAEIAAVTGRAKDRKKYLNHAKSCKNAIL